MKERITKPGLLIPVLVILFMTGCNDGSQKQSRAISATSSKANADLAEDSIVYKTETLILRRLSKHVYQHISFLNTESFGRVACNGMLVVNNKKAIVFDTPADDESSEELINYVTQKLGSTINAVIPTHFHEDCVGGIKKFNEHQVPVYASDKTIQLLKNKGNKYAGLIKGFADSLVLNIGGQKVYAGYFGEGHTKDNIIGYFPEDSIMFGGCLVKETGATKGNLEDANVSEWPATVLKLKQHYEQAKIVIPGHGKPGGTDLLDYTITLFSKSLKN